MDKKMLKASIILAGICLISALTLAIINSFTAPRIAFLEKQALEQALLKVSNNKKLLEKIDINDDKVINYYYKLEGGGYLFSLNATGYGGSMLLLASYDDRAKLLNSKLLSNAETPGLGKQAESDSYMKMYKKDPIPASKADLTTDEANSVSGASITFMGIANALNYAAKYIKEDL